LGPLAPLTIKLRGVADQAYEAIANAAGGEIPVLHAATLALASSVLPAASGVGIAITPIGCNAFETA
jgi:hypothetical protein